MKNASKEACRCKNVTYAKIKAAIDQGAKTPEQVQAITGYGTGCGQCREFVDYLIRQLLEGQES